MVSHAMNQNSSPERTSSGRSSGYSLLECSLHPWWRAALFLLPVAAFSIGLSWKTVRVARVTSQLDSLSAADVQKAIRQDPGNADLLHRLGLLNSLDPSAANVTEAVKLLRQAVEINPRHWDYWADLGTACDFAGDTACSDAAFQRARILNPMTPAVQWIVANHFVLTNRPEKAFPCFHRLLELDPTYLENTFRLCFRATRDPQAIYSQVIPAGKDPSARFAFLLFLGSNADYENAMKIWGQMISGPDRSPDLAWVRPFLDMLIDHDQIDDARKVWDDLQHASIVPAMQGGDAANLLYNGGFEREPLNTGFDWRSSDSPDLIFDWSDSSAYQGSKCLHIDFPLGRNAEYELVNQVVPIRPNTSYQVTAYVRSQDLTSDSGPRLRVIQLGCADCDVRTSEPTVGSTPWHPVDVEFLTRPQTQAIRVSFWRPVDHVTSRDITGSVWLDDVTLRAVESPGLTVSSTRNR